MGWASKFEDETDVRLENGQNSVARRDNAFDLTRFRDEFAFVRRSVGEFDAERLDRLEQQLTKRFEDWSAVMERKGKIGKKVDGISKFHDAAHSWVQYVAPIVRRMKPGSERRRCEAAVARFRKYVGI